MEPKSRTILHYILAKIGIWIQVFRGKNKVDLHDNHATWLFFSILFFFFFKNTSTYVFFLNDNSLLLDQDIN